MPSINSFVFFDTETTGLPTFDQPKITELAFVACSREHLLSPNQNKNKIPRVIFKLLLPFHPLKRIETEASQITHLDNWLLENCKPLDGNAVDMMKCFFNQLNKPICLVAHYGNRFDYPTLKRQLKKLNRSFDDDLLCVDSWEIFKELDKRTGANGSTANAYSSPKTFYKLPVVYKRLIGCEPEDTHCAEVDALSVLKCAVAIKDNFVSMADSTAINFNNTEFKYECA